MPTALAGLSGQLFDTVGLEIEGTLQDREYMQQQLIPKLAKVMGNSFKYVVLDRDASTESRAETLAIGSKYRIVSQHTSAYRNLSMAGSGSVNVYGYEFKTQPIEISKLEKVLYPLMFTLYEFGDVISDRSSIHCHVGFANNFRMLKSLLVIMLHLEPVLYRLGGMGGLFRGHLNNAAYCRPLLNSCVVPIAQMSHTKQFAHIINGLAARDAANISDFWAAFGLDYSQSSQHKYHASRYSGMNFFALYSHGTAEWRYFNKSFDVPLVISITKLMRAIVETSSLLSRRELGRFDVIDSSKEISVNDAEGTLGMLLAMCHEKGVENIPTDNEVAHILEVLAESSFTPLPEKPTNCHIKEFAITPQIVAKGHLKIVDDYLRTNYVDIHNIEERPLSIFS